MSRFGALRQLGGRKASKGEAAKAEAQSGVGGSLTRASELIDEVVRAAERAAEQIASDADSRGEGRASVIDRERVASELMKSLAERTDKLRSEAHELARILERAAPLVQAAQDPAPEQPAAPQQPVVPPLPASAESPYGPASGSVPPPSVSPGATAPQPPAAAPEPPPAAPEPQAFAPSPEPPAAAPEPQAFEPEPPPAAPEPQAFEPAPPAATPVAEPVTQVEPAPAPETFSFGTSTAVAEPLADEPVAEPAPLEPLGESRRKAQPHPSEGIRLLATQMAVAGSSHHEIEERLRREFGVSDADEIIAEVFGARE